MQTWQMQDAKARLSEVLRRAERGGPQDITLHGRSVAVMLSRETFDRLTGADETLVDFMRRSPLYGNEEVVLERDVSLTRSVPL